MANGEASTSHARARQLLKKRRDIRVHPTNALSDDSAETAVSHHYYRSGEVLVRNEGGQLDAFERAADRFGLPYHRLENHAQPKLRYEGTERPSPLPAAVRYHVHTDEPLEDILCRLEDHGHEEFEVTPNHVLFGLELWGMDPYGDPQLLKGDEKTHLEGDGAGVHVVVVDSGLPRGYKANPLLHENVKTWPSEEEPWDYDSPTPILSGSQGHGSFVAGMVRQAAQNATMTSYRALDTDGVTDEWYLGYQLSLVLASGAQVVNLSLGTTTRRDQKLMGLSALEAAAKGQGVGRAPIVVAAAGNLGDSRRVWPAADDWTISVGAVGRDLTPAPFSSHGPWVDVCTQGVDVVSSFEAKPFQGSSDPDKVEQFKGEAVWSGTSFAAPHVSGKVAGILQTDPNLDRREVLAKLKDLGGGRRVQDLGWYVP
jgi:subtilisin family serine protease